MHDIGVQLISPEVRETERERDRERKRERERETEREKEREKRQRDRERDREREKERERKRERAKEGKLIQTEKSMGVVLLQLSSINFPLCLHHFVCRS